MGTWILGEFWVFFLFWVFLGSSLPFCLVCRLLFVLWLFLLVDDLLEIFLAFLSSSCASWILDSNFKFCAFYYRWTHQGGDWETKWSVPWFDCDESLTCRALNLNPRQFQWVLPYLCFIWRTAFACLVVCRWQVRYGGQRRGSWQE
jgi:hypothetical protein